MHALRADNAVQRSDAPAGFGADGRSERRADDDADIAAADAGRDDARGGDAYASGPCLDADDPGRVARGA